MMAILRLTLRGGRGTTRGPLLPPADVDDDDATTAVGAVMERRDIR